MNNNCKIEFRAVPFGYDTHVLEWRYAPDQDLEYEIEQSLLFGLIKRTVKKRHSTKWRSIYIFKNKFTSYLYEPNDEFHYDPIFINSHYDLAVNWKGRCTTVEEFRKYIEEIESKEIQEYTKLRKEYFERRKIWE